MHNNCGDRRDWRESEQVIMDDLYPDYDRQAVIVDGVKQESKRRVKGSTVPDGYSEANKHSVEIKNYNLSTVGKQNRMVNNITDQYKKRLNILSKDIKQTVVIDIYGQNVSDSVQKQMKRQIKKSTSQDFEVRFYDKE